MKPFFLESFRGDSLPIGLTVTVAGAVVDLTHAQLFFTLKQSASDPDSAALVKKDSNTGGITITDAPNGVALVNLIPDDTATLPLEQPLVADVQLIDGNGNLFTVASGTLVVHQDITLRTS